MATNIDKVFETAIDLAQEGEDSFLELASQLRQIHERDRDLFRRFIATSGISRRKAYYLVKADKQFRKIPVPRSRIRALGWTKLHMIGPALTETNYEKLITLAEQNSAPNLKLLVKGEKPIKGQRCVTLYLSDDQYALLEKLLVDNGAKPVGRGLQDKEGALMKVLTEAAKHKATP